MKTDEKAETTKKPKRAKRQFSEEFRRDAVALIESTGEPLAKLAAQLGVTHWNLRDWLKRYRPQGAGATATPAEELRALVLRLQKENDELRSQRDVLKKAMGILATPKRSVTR